MFHPNRLEEMVATVLFVQLDHDHFSFCSIAFVASLLLVLNLHESSSRSLDGAPLFFLRLSFLSLDRAGPPPLPPIHQLALLLIRFCSLFLLPLLLCLVGAPIYPYILGLARVPAFPAHLELSPSTRQGTLEQPRNPCPCAAAAPSVPRRAAALPRPPAQCAGPPSPVGRRSRPVVAAAPSLGHCRASSSTRLQRSACYAATMGDETSTSVSRQPQEAAVAAAQGAGSVKQQIARLVVSSLRVTVPEVDVEPMVEVCTAKFGDYQCNNAMGIWSRIKGSGTSFRNPNAVGQAIANNLPASDIIESTSVAGPGFVNIVLSNSWVAKRIHDMLVDGIKTWAPILPVKRAVLDFSSPNIAKEMHVGHLRSTIIGDTLARMFEFSNVEVLRRNHVGDWGTQFGMLIEFLFEKFPNWEELGSQAIGDLQLFYKASKQKFDDDPEFKDRAQQAVVRLQGGEKKYRAAWKKICEISRNEFDQVYKLLHVELEEKGESFYNPYIPQVLEELSNKGLIKESEGAQVIFIEGHQIPLIVVKRDGGFNYASTDLAALWYRLNVEKAEWIIYVTDVGQQQHFDMFFKAARMAGWLPDPKEKKFPKTSHVGFGLVLGADGKRFRTRSTEVVRLGELLNEAKSRSKQELLQRLTENGKIVDWTDEELDKTSEAVGYGAVKYADLKNNRLTNYTFSFEQMLNDKGNTAVYLQYAHARICSIIRKSNKNVEELKMSGNISLGHPDERVLGLYLIRFAEVVEEACTNLLPSVLCEYLYNLSEMFTRFYTSCQVVGTPEEESRLLLCEATAIVMRRCFQLLGITPVYKL